MSRVQLYCMVFCQWATFILIIMCFNSLALKLYEKHVNHLFQTAETVATLRNGIGLNEKEYKLYISSKFC